jgi:hypothetical protein
MPSLPVEERKELLLDVVAAAARPVCVTAAGTAAPGWREGRLRVPYRSRLTRGGSGRV